MITVCGQPPFTSISKREPTSRYLRPSFGIRKSVIFIRHFDIHTRKSRGVFRVSMVVLAGSNWGVPLLILTKKFNHQAMASWTPPSTQQVLEDNVPHARRLHNSCFAAVAMHHQKDGAATGKPAGNEFLLGDNGWFFSFIIQDYGQKWLIIMMIIVNSHVLNAVNKGLFNTSLHYWKPLRRCITLSLSPMNSTWRWSLLR